VDVAADLVAEPVLKLGPAPLDDRLAGRSVDFVSGDPRFERLEAGPDRRPYVLERRL
jgi:hypothetical protein